jgi:hypothetical protein
VFVEKMGELDELGRRIYNDFSKDRMSEEEKKQLEDDLFREPFQEKSSAIHSELVIEAGITQWLQEKLPTKRELEGNLFNKLFQNIKGKQQEAAREALGIAERTYALVTEAFERLDDERRNIMEYVKLAREYHKNLSMEKRKLQKRYTDYFPAAEPEKPEETAISEGQAAPPATTAPVTTAPATPPAIAPPTTVPPTPPPAAAPPAPQPTDKPETPPDPNNPNKKAADDLVTRAKRAIFAGDVGVGIALLVKASEIYDEIGDEPRSIGLLKAASDLDRIRGRTVDCCYLDVDQSFPNERTRFTKDQIEKAFQAGFGKHVHITSTPKFMVDGKEIK